LRISRDDLEKKYMEPRFGLVDCLTTYKLLDDEELEDVKTLEGKPIRQNRLIIDCLMKKPSTELERFVTALKDSDQQHVGNFIVHGKGL
jgi:hypothetical protein